MEIEHIKITDLKPAEYNPRRISDEDYQKLKNSISTFGLVDPIIVNLKNMTGSVIIKILSLKLMLK